MKAAELKQQLADIRARVTPHAELFQQAQNEEGRLVGAHSRQYSVGNQATAFFEGQPDSHVHISSIVLTPERMVMLSEIVVHVEQWKAGIVDELAPSGAWPLVGPGYEKSR